MNGRREQPSHDRPSFVRTATNRYGTPDLFQAQEFAPCLAPFFSPPSPRSPSRDAA